MLDERLLTWLPNDKRLEPFYDGIIKFVDEHIDLAKLKKYSTAKEILDPCVGYVKLHKWEMSMIDTPLFQRLRKITQLGLAYHVYPTLRYSRLEHTIGVVGRLNQILQKLKEKHDGKDQNEKIHLQDVLTKYETTIRLAALFHDLGHCIYSHLSESVINEIPGLPDENYPSTKLIKDIFKEQFAAFDTNLTIAEIFSITILGTKKVADVLIKGNINIHVDKHGDRITMPEQLGEHLHDVARFIAGLPVKNDARTVCLAQLISSGLDADKLDYMSREEHFSGIKIEMDLERIYNKLKLFHISEESDLPRELLKYSKYITDPFAHKDYIVLGIEKGGQFSYEEFCVARLALYEKIYLHKKVRAAEAFLKKKLEKLYEVNDTFKKAHNWLYLKESITENKHDYVETKFIIAVPGELDFQNYKKEYTEINFAEIENREIPHRAFGFGPANSKTDKDISKLAEFSGIEENHLILDSVRFWNWLNPLQMFNQDIPSQLEQFTDKIINEAVAIIKTIRACKESKSTHVSDTIKVYDKEDSKMIAQIRRSLIIDVPNYKRVQLKYESLNFEEASYQTVRWTIPIDQIARYYQLHRILAYVFTEKQFCPIIYLAAERVIHHDRAFKPKPVYDQKQVVSKEIYSLAKEVKDYLHKYEPKFYHGFEDLLPMNEDLVSVSAKGKINQVLHKLNRLIYFNSKGLRYIDIENFLKQFKTSDQLPALNLISCIEVLSNTDLYEEINSIVKEQNPDADEEFMIGILPLGSYMSSSSFMMKEFEPFFDRLNIQQLTFSDKEKFLKARHIVLIDDNINTGRQALNILAKMLDINLDEIKSKGLFSPKVHEQGGEGEKIKDDEVRSHFLKTPLTFIFITGYEKSKQDLEAYLREYCKLEQKIDIRVKHTLYQKDRLFSGRALTEEEKRMPLTVFQQAKENFKESPERKTSLKDFLEKVGTEVVKTRSIHKRDKEDTFAHCLGYHNRESLVIFPGSVPTMTITALWCSGEYEDEGESKSWKALIERPKKEAR